MRCVYTVLLGGYERLNEQPTAHSSSIEFICLTDDPTLTSISWRIELITPLIPNDPIRSQRHLKIMGHELLNQYSETLYIDNSVLLKKDPEYIFENFGGRSSLALPRHSFRATVEDEFREITALYLDDPGLIGIQHQRYEDIAPEIFSESPYWTAILIRDHSRKELQPLMEMWWAEVAKFSRRDQLSINACLRLSNLWPLTIDIDNYHSEFHRWPIAKSKRNDLRHWDGRIPSQIPLPARVIGKLALLARRLRKTSQK